MKVNFRSAAQFRAAAIPIVPVLPPDDDKGSVAIVVTPGAGLVTGQAAHFRVSPTSINALAAAAGVGMDEFEATSETFWEYALGNDAENYVFEGLPADHLGATTAGWSLGRFGAHVYVGAAIHTARVSIYRLGRLVAQGTRQIAVEERRYAVADTAWVAPVLPVAGADGVPADATNLYTDLNAAYAWACAAPGRAVWHRRGGSYALTDPAVRNLPTNVFLGAWGSGPRPKVNVDFRYAGARIDVVASGAVQTVSNLSLATGIFVYFDNALQAEGIGYVRGVGAASNQITLQTARSGQRVRVFNLDDGARPLLGGGVVFRLGGGTGQIIRDIDFSNGYDPVSPGSFDRNDLSTANAWIATSFIQGGVGTTGYATVFRCGANGFLDGFNVTLDADVLAVVDVNFDRWANYPIFVSKTRRLIVLGCSAVQPAATRNGLQKKRWNTPIQSVYDPARPVDKDNNPLRALNAPFHGPMRLPYCFETVVGACRFDSRTSWAGDEPGRAQPVVRFVQSAKPGQSYCFVQSHTTGGQGCYGGGAKNGWDVQSKSGLCEVGYNVMVSYPSKESFGTGAVRVRSISNLYVVPAGTGATRSFQLFRSRSASTILARADAPVDPWVSINDTVLLLDDRANTFDLNPSYVIASTGIQCKVSVVAAFPAGTAKDARPGFGGYPVPAASVGTSTVRVPLNVNALSVWKEWATRIWRGPTEAAATSAPTVSAQALLYDYQYHGYGLNVEPNENALKQAEWIELTLKNGTWAAGDTVWISRELTEETGGAVELSDPEDEEETAIVDVVFAAAETFVPNNRPVDLVRPPATLHNTLLLVGGTWAAVQIAGTPVDQTAYRPAIFGAWDGAWRPAPGNAVIGGASGVRAAFDVRGRLRTGNALGALEPDTDLTDWPALITQAPVVTLSLSPSGYNEGDAFGVGRIVVAVTTAGTPPLLASDVATVAEVQSTTGAVISTAGSGRLEASQRVVGRGRYSHVTVPVTNVATAPATVQALTFAPAWINSNPDPAALASTARLGARSYVTGLAASPTANHHVAFRLRNRHSLAVNGSARLFNGSSPTRGVVLSLSHTGAMAVVDLHQDGGTGNTVTLGTIPTTGAEVSVLVSSYLEGNGPGGITCRVQWMVNGVMQTPMTRTTVARQLFTTNFRIFSATQGTPDIDFRQFYGTWTGGVPDLLDLFGATGEVKNWGSDPTLGVPGMVPLAILNGIGGPGVTGTFNAHLDNATPTPRPWIAGAA